MFTLARVALHRLYQWGLQAGIVLSEHQLFDETSLRLTEGQYLDISFESRLDVSVDEYLAMIEGKTAALLSASLRLGALVGGAPAQVQAHLAEFGRNLGLAFQIQDDLLGIWGDEAQTGKSAQSDILTRKKTLPVLYALAHPQAGPALRTLYVRPLAVEDVPAVLDLLAQADAQAYAEQAARQAHGQALKALRASGVLDEDNDAGQALLQIAEGLLSRQR